MWSEEECEDDTALPLAAGQSSAQTSSILRCLTNRMWEQRECTQQLLLVVTTAAVVGHCVRGPHTLHMSESSLHIHCVRVLPTHSLCQSPPYTFTVTESSLHIHCVRVLPTHSLCQSPPYTFSVSESSLHIHCVRVPMPAYREHSLGVQHTLYPVLCTVYSWV